MNWECVEYNLQLYSTFATAIVSSRTMQTQLNSIRVFLYGVVVALLPGWTTAAENDEAGRRLFEANCAECHQSDGMGIPNIYPALAGNETVQGSAIDVALVLRIGRGEMPSFRDSLGSEELAIIINYIRNAWGNTGENITAETIDKLR